MHHFGEQKLSSSFLENINPVLDKFANVKNKRANLLKNNTRLELVNFSKLCVFIISSIITCDIYFAVNFSLV